MRHLDVQARRFGPDPSTSAGSPLSPATPVDHASWFVPDPVGGIGLLQLADTLHLAVGPDGRGWRLVDGTAEPLAFDADPPSELDAESPAADRHAPLAPLRWCRVTPRPGERFLLVTCTVSVDPSTDLDALAEPPSPGFFARLLGAKPVTGLVVSATVGEPGLEAPAGFLPWLRHHDALGMPWYCWGTEGGGEMELHEGEAPDDVVAALVELARTHEAFDPDMFTDLHGNWAESGMDRAPDLVDLVDGHPERGTWRPIPIDDLAEVFQAYHHERGPHGLRHERTLRGDGLVDRLREALIGPAAIAVHAEPHDDSVVVWFVVGGVSRTSGRLEVLLSERVWS